MLTPANLTVLGTAGEAAGERLRLVKCAEPSCADAVAMCHLLPRCDTVEVTNAKAWSLREEYLPSPRRGGSQPVAVLRAAYVRFGAPHAPRAQLLGAVRRSRGEPGRNPQEGLFASRPRTRSPVSYCERLSRQARAVGVGHAVRITDRNYWHVWHCDEYAATANRPLPHLAVAAAAEGMQRPADASGGSHCPPAGTRFLVLGFQSGPSPWLCALLRSAGYNDVPITIVGWEPSAYKRASRGYFFGAKFYSVLHYLVSCRAAGLRPDATVLVVDTDQLIQLPLRAMRARLDAALRAAAPPAEPPSSSSVVLAAAESRCETLELRRRSLAALASRGHSEPPAPPSGSKLPGEASSGRKSPREEGSGPVCLNAGDYAGRLDAVIELLNRSCAPCARGVPLADLARTLRGYTELMPSPWRRGVANDQAALSEAYLGQPLRARPDSSTSAGARAWLALDRAQRLFLPLGWAHGYELDGRRPRAAGVRKLADGRLASLESPEAEEPPGLVHFNGNSKGRTRGPYSPAAVATALRAAFHERRARDVRGEGGAAVSFEGAASASLDAYLRERTRFVSPSHRRVEGVTFADVCRAGDELPGGRSGWDVGEGVAANVP